MNVWSIILGLLEIAPTAAEDIKAAFDAHPTTKIGTATVALQTAAQIGVSVANEVAQSMPGTATASVATEVAEVATVASQVAPTAIQAIESVPVPSAPPSAPSSATGLILSPKPA